MNYHVQKKQQQYIHAIKIYENLREYQRTFITKKLTNWNKRNVYRFLDYLLKAIKKDNLE